MLINIKAALGKPPRPSGPLFFSVQMELVTSAWLGLRSTKHLAVLSVKAKYVNALSGHHSLSCSLRKLVLESVRTCLKACTFVRLVDR